VRSDRRPGRGCLQPISALLECAKEILKPTILIAEPVRSWPYSELFEIIAHGRVPVRMRGSARAKKFNRFGRRSKWNQVAQRFQARQNFDGVALILSEVVSVELIEFKSGPEKMIVVNKGVAHA